MTTLRFLNSRFWLTAILLLTAQLALAAAPTITIKPEPPKINGTAWFLIDYQSGQVLAQHNANTKLAPASLTKLMTAYIVEQQVNLGNISEDDMVPISVKAWKTGGSRMFLREGTRVKLSKLMKGLIVVSGNDAAVALAEYVAGSSGAFANMMNTMAAKLGMTNTHYMNPTGLPDKNHYSTAKDLATLAWHIIHDYPDHFKLYDIKSFTYNDITQHNRVLLLWRDPRVDGLKTGHTKEAGYCQVTTAIGKDGMRLIGVVMGTTSTEERAVESAKLINYGFRFFQNYTAYQAGKALVSPRIWLGTSNHVKLGITQDMTVTVPNGAAKHLKADVKVNPAIKAPITQGQQLGTVSLTLNGKLVKSEPLVALNAVPEAGLFSRLWDHIVMFVTSFFS